MPIETKTSSSKSARFETIGDRIEGVIISAKEDDQTDIETGQVKRWQDGTPMKQWVIELQTTLNDGDDDDGKRTVWAKGGRFEAAQGDGQSLMEALRSAADGKPIEEGAHLIVQMTGLGKKKNPAYASPKLFKAKYTPAPKGINTTAVDPFA